MSLFGKRTEELGHLRELLEGVNERINELERKVKEILNSEMTNLRAELGSIKNVQPSILIEEFKEAINMLKASLVTAEYLKEYEIQLRNVLELQNSQVDQLERVRRSIAEEWDRLRNERERLEELRHQMELWRKELEVKEANLASYENNIKALEERKEELEKRVKELGELYIASLEQAQSQLEKTIKDIDKRFRIREIKLDRLSRLEERKREELAKIESEKAMVNELAKKAASLLEEVQRLERRKSILINEINKLEVDRKELERVKQELRSSVLK